MLILSIIVFKELGSLFIQKKKLRVYKILILPLLGLDLVLSRPLHLHIVTRGFTMRGLSLFLKL